MASLVGNGFVIVWGPYHGELAEDSVGCKLTLRQLVGWCFLGAS